MYFGYCKSLESPFTQVSLYKKNNIIFVSSKQAVSKYGRFVLGLLKLLLNMTRQLQGLILTGIFNKYVLTFK